VPAAAAPRESLSRTFAFCSSIDANGRRPGYARLACQRPPPPRALPFPGGHLAGEALRRLPSPNGRVLRGAFADPAYGHQGRPASGANTRFSRAFKRAAAAALVDEGDVTANAASPRRHHRCRPRPRPRPPRVLPELTVDKAKQRVLPAPLGPVSRQLTGCNCELIS